MHNYLQSVTDASIREDLRQRFEDVRAYYNPCQQNPEDLLKEPIALRPQLPQWFLIEHRKHAIPYMLVDALVNGKQHHSGSCVSLHIRQCCYKILGVEKVKEYHMNADEAAIISIKCTDLQLLHMLYVDEYEVGKRVPSPIKCAKILECPCYDYIPETPVCVRASLLLSILGCTQSKLGAVHGQDKFFMCTVMFWKAQTSPPTHVIKTLLACFVLCNTKSETLDDIRGGICCDIPESYRESPEWPRDRQFFSDWQCVYSDALALNVLLQYPLPNLCPSRIYDGKIAMSLASQLNKVEEVIPSLGISMEKYEKLLQIVLPKRHGYALYKSAVYYLLHI